MPESEKILYDPLLQSDHSDDGSSDELPRPRNSSRRLWISAALAQVVLIMLYTGASILFVRSVTAEKAKSDVNAFPGLAVNYEYRKFDFFPNSTFAGVPRPESEEAWHKLMSNMAVRVTAEELAVHNQTSVALPNGGYMAWLGVFHELHCVKILRHWSWRDYYEDLANMTTQERNHHMIHVDHCIETLRSQAICRADTEALAVFKWNAGSPRPIFDTRRVDHRCVNWDDMMTSHTDRVVTVEEIDSMVNPLMDQDGRD